MKLIIKQIIILLFFSIIVTKTYAQENPYYEVQNDEGGNPQFLKHQIIIAFNPSLIKKDKIDNSEFISGKLKDFFTDDAITIAQSIGIWNDDIANAPTSKIYQFLDSDDTLSITRSGEVITIPKYWATLLVFWPLSDNTPIQQVCDSLIKFYPLIEFAHPNYLYPLNAAATDPYYTSDQFNLHPDPNSSVNGNIDIENAWDIETGSPNIKIGVFDNPIIYTHEDFGGGSLSTSKIKGGKVYYQVYGVKDISTFNINTVIDNHGTSVAGIAAAIRNNEKGIAGVAGGDYSASPSNLGASLYTFGIYGDPSQTGTLNGYCTDAMAADAITEGAQYILQPGGTYKGYNLDIENHSWGGPSLSDNVRRAIKGAARNQCAVVCSRGNDVSTNGTTTDNFPATYNDEWVINVGASGTNGKRLNIAEGNVGNVPGTGSPSVPNPNPWSSMYGKNMDVLAPGSQSLLISTINSNIFQPFGQCQYSNYCYFVGTSAAAPHVSGLAALILSKYRTINGFYTHLEPEDVENLIEKYATHTYPITPYNNDLQGWGRINPDNTLDKIKDNRYKIYHFTNGWPVTYNNLGNITLNIPIAGAFGLTTGTYTAQKWKIVQSYTNTFGSNEQILGYWPRLNSTVGSNDFSSTSLTEDDYASYSFSQNGNKLTVDATSYAYYIPSLAKWLYKDKVDVNTAYSVHTFDPTANAVNEIAAKKNINLKVYPNPAKNEVKIDMMNLQFQSIEVYDIKGAKINIEYSVSGKNIILNTSSFPEGFYICKIIINDGNVSMNKILIAN